MTYRNVARADFDQVAALFLACDPADVAFHRRGRMRVELGVDSANSTGATLLYERVGTRERFRFDRYEKTLS